MYIYVYNLQDFIHYACTCTLRMQLPYVVYTVHHFTCIILSTPQEADFVGKAAIKRIKSEKLQRKLVMMTVDTGNDNIDPEGNETVWSGDEVRKI